MALRQQVFRRSERTSAGDLEEYFDRIFFRQPGRPDDLPSLVCGDDGGQIAGFLGVIPRRMEFRGTGLRVAVATQLMVRPGVRGFTGTRLARALMAGAQDLILSDTANDAAHRVWRRVGGASAPGYRVLWTRVLRPWEDAFSSAPLRVARPVWRALDRGSGPWCRPPSRGSVGPFDAAHLSTQLPEFASGVSLRPVYEAPELDWLLSGAREKRLFGPLLEAAVWRGGRLSGWFLYYARRGDVAQVAQVAARPGHVGPVLDHLFHHAWRQGAVAVSGRVEPWLLPELAVRGCRFDRSGPWMLIHARNAEVARAIQAGDAFLSRMEGEWWMSF